MKNSVTQIVERPWADALNERVEQFETALEHAPEAKFEDFLPPSDDPSYLPATAELVRVEMESRWNSAHPCRLTAYRLRAPQLFQSSEHLREVAFEEYRLCRSAGEDVSPEQYAQQYGIETADWPRTGRTWDTDAQQPSTVVGPSRLDVSWPEVGERFLHFEIERVLGHGSFGRVYLARQDDLARRHVVLKITALESAESDHLARLQHTNIVPIFSVHRIGKQTCICMPYFGRHTLADILAAQRDSSALGAANVRARQDNQRVEILRTLTRLSDGLAYAHRQGIVHGDLKPANVLIGDDGEPRLLDFNLAQQCGNKGDKLSSHVGGTLPYMAPEQLRALRDGGVVDQRADIYAFGVMLYESLTLVRPFPDRTGTLDSVCPVMIADRRAGAPSIRQHAPKISPAVVAIVERCLQWDPDQRYPSAVELAEDLACHLSNHLLVHAPNRSLRERLQKWCRRHPRATSGVTVAIVASSLLALITTGLLWRQHQVRLLEANNRYQAFQRDVVRAVAALTVSSSEPSVVASGRAVADEALKRWELPDKGHISESLYFSYLDQSARSRLEKQVAKLQLVADHSTASGALLFEDDREVQETLRLVEARDYDQALKRVDARIAEMPLDPIPWLLRGNVATAMGEYSDAEGAYSIYIGLMSDSYVGYFYRGRTRLERNEWQGAIADFTRAYELQPKLLAALLNRALAYEGAKELQLAEQDLNMAIDAGARETRVYFLRSRIRRQLGNVTGSKADLQTGLGMTPEDELSWVARGTARIAADAHGALDDFAQALRLNPESQAAWQNRLFVLVERLHDGGRALESIDERLTVKPDDVNAMAARAVLLARLGRVDEARRGLEKLTAAAVTPTHTYQAACVHALMDPMTDDDINRGLQYLRDAFARQPSLAASAAQDPDLRNLHDNTAFRDLVETYRQLAGSGKL